MAPPAENDVDGPRCDGRIVAFRRAYTDAILRGDADGAEQLVGDAIAASIGEATIQDCMIAPALRRVGDLWEAGEIGVADEHAATEISLRVLALQHEAFRVARRRARYRVLLAAVQGERHDVGLRMAASLLLHDGFDVRMLGANLPLAALATAIERHAPSVVGLSATMPGSSAELQHAIGAIRAAAPEAGIIVGGAAARTLVPHQPGIVVCRHVSDTAGLVEGLVQRAHGN